MCPRILALPAILTLVIWTASRCPHEFYVVGVYLFVLFIFNVWVNLGVSLLGFFNKYLMLRICYVFSNLDHWIVCMLHIKSTYTSNISPIIIGAIPIIFAFSAGCRSHLLTFTIKFFGSKIF